MKPSNRSCQFCRARKIKCDTVKPTCGSCQRHRRHCVYLVEPPRQRPSKALINAAHTQRRAVENVLVALKQADSAVRDEILNSVTIQANGSLHIPSALASAEDANRPCSSSQERVGSNTPAVEKTIDELHDSTSDEEYDPTTFLSRDECGTVGIFGLTSALHARSPTDDAQSSPRTRAEPDRYQLIAEAALQRQKEHDLRVLPTIAGISAELAMHLLDLHWNRQHHTFLLTYRPAFMRDLLHGGPYCSEFLLNAVFACSSKFSERPDVRTDPRRPETAGKRFFERCDQIIAEESLLTRSSIPTIAGLIMLGSTFNAWGQTSKGWLYTGFALRMVYDLGLHLDCKEIAGSSAEDIEVRRRVFWAAFICDKLQSLYLGRPFTIQLRDAHVSRDFMDTFEENELWTPYVDPLNPPSHSPHPFRPTRIHSVSVFQQLCSLSKIMTSIIDRFYMVSATGPRARKHLDQIDRRLTTWYLKLPPALRFEPWADDPTAPSPATVAAPNIIILLTTYNALVILLHRPFIGTGQPASDSWERCLTAARNITSLALAYRSAYSLRRANYLLSYALYVACTIHARNPAIRESTRRKEASSPLTVCLRCLDELAVPNCGVSTPARIIRRLMEANGMDAEGGDDVNFQESFPVDMNLDFQMLPGLDFRVGQDSENLMLHDFNPDVDLLFGFMSGSYLDMNGVV
ncbi:fungal-specific transcription factor domain-containing protein [Aspergillus floccosus]